MNRFLSDRTPPVSVFALLLLASLVATACREEAPWPPGLQDVPDASPVLAPEAALKTFFLPPGYRIELVAAEPLVQDPVAIDFDPQGRLWVVEMRGYMPNIDGTGEEAPVGSIAVLEDDDDDGRMDRRTVYLDSLVLPRAVKVLDAGVLVAAPPYLWLTRDTDGDLKADTREVVRTDYGTPSSNPEHNANGLMWGLDNWIHNAKYEGQLRLEDGRFRFREAPAVGQWGVSTDDYGRLYRNYNEDPLHVDLVDAHYYARNPHLTRTRGLYEETVETEEGKFVWPVRPTTGVNRGYREQVLRDDGRLRTFTAAGSPVVYRGDRLPEELLNNVFVTEPAGNLVHRYVLTEDARGRLQARNPYAGEQAEFLASTDERFRPVNLYSAPDGTLYVVDMYRGIIQHRQYVTGYLEQQIRQRDLETPLGLGRIYRVVHRSTRRAAAPRLANRTPAELVDVLAHPNGWWRDTAQRLLVERGDRSVAPALRALLGQPGADPRTRLHALWTLDGLGEADRATVEHALEDASPHVRAAAVRISESRLAGADPALWAAVLARVDDDAPVVRRQLAASLGALPAAERGEALAAVLARYGDDPVVVDAAVSGLPGQERGVLGRLLANEGLPGRPDAVAMLAAALVRRGEAEDVAALFGWIGDEALPAPQRLALLDGVARVARVPDEGEVDETRRLPLERRPDGLLAAAAAADSTVQRRATRIARALEWPGKPEPPARSRVRPLTPDEQQRFEAGRQQYLASCAPCHQPDGAGLPGVANALIGSPWVVGSSSRLIRILLHGKEGEMLMPPQGTLSDEQIAAILTYIRRAWEHEAAPITPEQVAEIRGQTTGRYKPWTEAELEALGRR